VSTLREELNEAAVAGLDPAKPVVMLNLMKFRARSLDGDGSGWDAYLRYSKNTSPLLKARGATILWTGDVRALALGPCGAGEWDYAALVSYPRPAAFLDMMKSPEYARGNVHRENGCEKHVILATHEAYSKLAAAKSEPLPRA
jgi:uncharacterized protein (DUF1330 family)